MILDIVLDAWHRTHPDDRYDMIRVLRDANKDSVPE